MPEIYIYITRRSSWERTKGRKRLLVQITYLAFYLSIDPVHRQGSVYRRIRKIYITFKNTSPPPGRKIFRIESFPMFESRERASFFETFFHFIFVVSILRIEFRFLRGNSSPFSRFEKLRSGWNIRKYGENYLWKRIWLILIGSIIWFENNLVKQRRKLYIK